MQFDFHRKASVCSLREKDCNCNTHSLTLRWDCSTVDVNKHKYETSADDEKKKIERQNSWIHSICLWLGKWLMAATKRMPRCVWSVGDAISFHCYRISPVIFVPNRTAITAANGIFSGFVFDFNRSRGVYFLFFFFWRRSIWYVTYAIAIIDTEVWNSSSDLVCWKIRLHFGQKRGSRGIRWIRWKRAIDRRSISNEPTFVSISVHPTKDLFLSER